MNADAQGHGRKMTRNPQIGQSIGEGLESGHNPGG
jgi:hypothetical protein